MEINLETLIEAPADRVFQVLTEVERLPDRVSAITHIEMLTSGPLRVGSRFRETRRMFGREATEVMTVAEMEPPERLVLTASGHGTDYRVEHLLAAEGARTRLSMAFSGVPRTFTAWLLAPLGALMKGSVKRQIAGDLAELKRFIEGG